MSTVKKPIRNPRAKSTGQKIIDAWNSHQAEKITPLYCSDYEGDDVTGGKVRHGHEGLKKWIESVTAAIPDIRYTLMDAVENENDLVLYWEAAGKQQGHLFRIPPTGLPVLMQGMSLLKLENGKVKKGKIIWDFAGVLRQLGLLPQMR
jgi:steroid delta-isomerase-like uncharacterized protein